jgi:hypothetical protein
MMKKNVKRSHSGFEVDYDSYPGKKVAGPKDKSSKRKLSIYDDYEEDEEYIINKKIKIRHK